MAKVIARDIGNGRDCPRIAQLPERNVGHISVLRNSPVIESNPTIFWGKAIYEYEPKTNRWSTQRVAAGMRKY